MIPKTKFATARLTVIAVLLAALSAVPARAETPLAESEKTGGLEIGVGWATPGAVALSDNCTGSYETEGAVSVDLSGRYYLRDFASLEAGTLWAVFDGEVSTVCSPLLSSPSLPLSNPVRTLRADWSYYNFSAGARLEHSFELLDGEVTFHVRGGASFWSAEGSAREPAYNYSISAENDGTDPYYGIGFSGKGKESGDPLSFALRWTRYLDGDEGVDAFMMSTDIVF